MDVSYTDYAEETLKDGEIGKEEIKLALTKPDKVSDGKMNRKIVHKLFGDRLLRVVFETHTVLDHDICHRLK